MKRHTLLALLLTSVALALPAAAQAQSGQSAAGASTTARHAAKKHAAAKKHTATKKHTDTATKKKSSSASHKAAKVRKGKSSKAAKVDKAPALLPVAPEQTPDQQAGNVPPQPEAVQPQVYTGVFPCDLGIRVSVAADDAHPGFFTVTAGKRRYSMHPVESRTGAIRMEDDSRGAVWLQLATKSMLMDQKAGQRVADGCVAPAQNDYAAYIQDHPQRKLFDTPTGSQQQTDGAAAPVGSAPSASSEQAPAQAADVPAGSDQGAAPR